MTDRLKGCTVAFERDIRVDDVVPLLDAIRHLRGVADVEPLIADPDDAANRMRINHVGSPQGVCRAG